MPPVMLQPFPFRVPLLNEQGQLVESWQRFFLSTQTLLNQVILVTSAAGQPRPIMLVDDADQGEGFIIPGPQGLIGPQGVTGRPGFDQSEDAIGLEPMLGFSLSSLSGSIPDVLLSPNVALLNRNPQGPWTGRNNYTAPQNNVALYITGDPTVGQSQGIQIQAGTNSSDFGLRVLDATGVQDYLTVNGDGAVNGSWAKTGSVSWTIANTLAGAANLAQLFIQGDAGGGAGFVFQALSSTYTPTGSFFANGARLGNAGAGGLSIVQTGTGDIRLYTTGAEVERLRIRTGGAVQVTRSLQVGFAAGTADSHGLLVLKAGSGSNQGIGIVAPADDSFLELTEDGTVHKINISWGATGAYRPLVIGFDNEKFRFHVSGGLSLGNTTDPGSANLSLTGKVATYNNIATVSGGVPATYAAVDTTGLTANVAAATLYAVPASGAGLYRISAYVVETTAASVSSTLPNVQVVYTDNDTGGAVTLDVTPVLGVAGTGQSGALTANTIGTVASGEVPINVKASTTIQYQTVNYASAAAGMTYAIHLKCEAL